MSAIHKTEGNQITVTDAQAAHDIYLIFQKVGVAPHEMKTGPGAGLVSFDQQGILTFHDPGIAKDFEAITKAGKQVLVQVRNPGPPFVRFANLMHYSTADRSKGLEPLALKPVSDVHLVTATVRVDHDPTEPDLICPCTGP